MTYTPNHVHRFGDLGLQFLAFSGDVFVIEVTGGRCDCCEVRSVRFRFAVPGWSAPSDDAAFAPCMMSLSLEIDMSAYDPDEHFEFEDADVVLTALDGDHDTRTDVTYRGGSVEADVLLKTAFRRVSGLVDDPDTLVDRVFHQLFEAELEPGEQEVFWVAEEVMEAVAGEAVH